MALLPHPPRRNPTQPQNSNRRNKARDRLFMAADKPKGTVEPEYEEDWLDVPFNVKYDGDEWTEDMV